MEETRFYKSWRPAMGWSYLAVCLWDFLIAPMFVFWWAHKTGTTYQPWKPITIAEGGLYHVAMGAIVGVTAWSRGQEKMARVNPSPQQEPQNNP
jgi:hypothetical protein